MVSNSSNTIWNKDRFKSHATIESPISNTCNRTIKGNCPYSIFVSIAHDIGAKNACIMRCHNITIGRGIGKYFYLLALATNLEHDGHRYVVRVNRVDGNFRSAVYVLYNDITTLHEVHRGIDVELTVLHYQWIVCTRNDTLSSGTTLRR